MSEGKFCLGFGQYQAVPAVFAALNSIINPFPDLERDC